MNLSEYVWFCVSVKNRETGVVSDPVTVPPPPLPLVQVTREAHGQLDGHTRALLSQ